MAGFKDVVKQQKRMCKTIEDCNKCPLRSMDHDCRLTAMIDADYDAVEVEAIGRIVMDWAAEHPEPRYPTWREWLRLEMDEAIPADIAEKLGIKPIGGADDEKA